MDGRMDGMDGSWLGGWDGWMDGTAQLKMPTNHIIGDNT